METGACKHTLMGHQSLTSGMELRNNILVSGNADSTVKVWDIVSGQCLQTLSGNFLYRTVEEDVKIILFLLGGGRDVNGDSFEKKCAKQKSIMKSRASL